MALTRAEAPDCARVGRLLVPIIFVAVSCSTASDAQPTRSEAAFPAPAVSSIQVVSQESTGTGFGVMAVADPTTSTTVLATSVGLFALPSGEEPVEIERFPSRSQATQIAMSPDGSTVAVALASPSSVLWYDVAERTTIGSVEVGIDQPVLGLEFGSDGSLLAQTPTDILVWPAGAGVEPVRPTDGSALLGHAALLPGGTVVAPIVGTADVFVGSMSDGRFTRQPVGGLDGATVVDAQSSANGTLAIAVARGPNEFERLDDVVVIDTATWLPRSIVEADRVTTISDWTVTDSHVVLADLAGGLAFDLDGIQVATLARPSNPDVAGVYAADQRVVTLHRDRTVTAWNESDWSSVGLVSTAGFSGASSKVGPGSISMVDLDGHVTSWHIPTGETFTDDDHFASGKFTAVAANDAGTRVVVGTAGGRALVYDEQLEPIAELRDDAGRIDAVTFLRSGDDVVTARAERLSDEAFDDTVTRWNTVAPEPTYRVGGDAETVPGCGFFFNRVRVTPDGTIMAVVSHTYEVTILDTASGETLFTFPPHGGTVYDVAFTDDGASLVTAADDGKVRVWDVATHALVSEYSAANGGFHAIAMLANGHMAISDVTGRISIVDVLTGEASETLDESNFRTNHIVVSSDGSIIAAPTTDGSVAMWATESGDLLTILPGTSAVITSLAFSGPDALVASYLDATAHLWRFDRA